MTPITLQFFLIHPKEHLLFMKKITSTHNAFIKSLVLLKEKSRSRKKSGNFLIEGQREISLAIKGGYEIETILFYPKICSEIKAQELSANSEIIEINKEVFTKLAYRETTEGVIVVAKSKNFNLSNLKVSDNPLILIAEATEKPGNIGAILRTADAARIDAVIIANYKSDMYNPNIIRSSIGCVFTTQIAVSETDDIISFLKENNINVYCASLQNSNFYHNQNFTKPTAIIVGNEANGLSKKWLDFGTSINIPMRGEIDSMNVSASAAVLIFEATRQRRFS